MLDLGTKVPDTNNSGLVNFCSILLGGEGNLYHIAAVATSQLFNQSIAEDHQLQHNHSVKA